MVFEFQLRSYCGWARGGQVNKIVEIIGLEVYCSTFQRTMGFLDNVGNSKLWHNEGSEGKGSDSLLAPCDISVSLLVCKFDLKSFHYNLFS
ncbi:hypothetical protein CJ030_MR0G008819 [Morella rubra]|uniref:Uncharacterized protein n=1 Tax=Morella rubra TaxID=262757 RepID=A0A6A1ULG4_9ROSI|nr:hypothetical protein CJ030_MR0G008819 [Morella rubra]